MSAVESIFSHAPTPPPTTVGDTAQVIDTVGVEVLEDSSQPNSVDLKVPANGNDVIPFASTLRRVG
jgi:hypothetical protein